jgi:hypothetical protein
MSLGWLLFRVEYGVRVCDAGKRSRKSRWPRRATASVEGQGAAVGLLGGKPTRRWPARLADRVAALQLMRGR